MTDDSRQFQCPEGNPYVVRPGDTLYLIAQRFNISVDDLIEANPYIDPNNLQVGQVICIPVAGPPARCPAGTFAYTVRPGDTFYGLARRFGVPVQAIINANPGVNPNFLLVGQEICIPGAGPGPGPQPGACPAGTFAYTVVAGDTFYTLARRFKTTVAAIQAANPGVNPNNLQIGQRLCIPG